jgi:uncharacterized membrane protein
MDNIENTNIQQPARKQERGRAFIVFGVIFVLLSATLILLAPGVVSSTIAENQGMTGGGLGGAEMRGFALEWAKGIAWTMVAAGVFFYVIGMIMLITGVVRERWRRKNTARNNQSP